MAIPHIVLYKDAQFLGDHTHFFESMSYVGDDFNDQTSSFVILEGQWTFFFDANWQTPMAVGRILGPGRYAFIEDESCLGAGTNDQLSSLRENTDKAQIQF